MIPGDSPSLEKIEQFFFDSNDTENDAYFLDERMQSIFSNIESKHLSLNPELLTATHLIEWHDTLIGIKEILTEKDVNKMDEIVNPFLSMINESLNTLKIDRREDEFAKFIGRSVYEFEQICPFKSKNKHVAQLIACFISSYLNIPLIKFSNDEEEKYHASCESIEKMTKLIAEKMIKVVFDPITGSELHLEKFFHNSGRYRNLKTGRTRIIEWHALMPLLTYGIEHPKA